MTRAKAWEVTDDFWSRVEPLIPVRQRLTDQPQYCSFRLHVWHPVALTRASGQAEPGRGHLCGFGVLDGRDWHRVNVVA